MRAPTITVAEIENRLDHAARTLHVPTLRDNPPVRQRTKKEYQQAVKDIEPRYYIDAAHYHYFVARSLFLNCVFEYSFFSAHQCLENYLKAFLKDKRSVPPNWHKLGALLEECRKNCSDADCFLCGPRADVVIAKYSPFYELPRYPVSKEGPWGYAYLGEEDIFILDYFVYRMRELVAVPSGHRDTFSDQHFWLQHCLKHRPEFYRLFKYRNVNFPDGEGHNQQVHGTASHRP